MSYLQQLFSLEGKIAVVTGASRGLGNAIAKALLRAGAHVILVSANVDRLAVIWPIIARLRPWSQPSAKIRAGSIFWSTRRGLPRAIPCLHTPTRYGNAPCRSM